tara:strand:- start:341 stop:1072 length:732 start_codon:yes stop_codon:yes gene_type:complete
MKKYCLFDMNTLSESDFSVINSNVKIVNQLNNKLIEKTICLNVDFDLPIKNIKCWIDDYYKIFRRIKINIPDEKASFCKGEKIIYKLEYLGLNMVQSFESIIDFYNDRKTLMSILNIIENAKNNNLYIDPHPKNFTLLNGKVGFVDFTPPYGIKDYRDARIKIEKSNRNIISKNLDVFHPNNLFYHFIGDMFNISDDYRTILKLYQFMYDNSFVNLPLDDGIKKAKSIRAIEDDRLSRNLFLM